MNKVKIKLLLVCLFLFSSKIYAEPCKGKDNTKWNNCVGTIIYDEFRYVGEFKNGREHGFGIYYKNNKIWEAGERTGADLNGTFLNGFGTEFHDDGGKIIGEFKDGSPRGYNMDIQDNYILIGEHGDLGLPHGYAIEFNFETNQIYAGEWDINLFTNGNIYDLDGNFIEKYNE